jgi:hypothetical protein
MRVSTFWRNCSGVSFSNDAGISVSTISSASVGKIEKLFILFPMEMMDWIYLDNTSYHDHSSHSRKIMVKKDSGTSDLSSHCKVRSFTYIYADIGKETKTLFVFRMKSHTEMSALEFVRKSIDGGLQVTQMHSFREVKVLLLFILKTNKVLVSLPMSA